MKKSDWKRKLTSRKLWAAVAAFITAICAAFGVSDIRAEQIVAVVTAAATMIAYIIGEGITDAASVRKRKERLSKSVWFLNVNTKAAFPTE